MTLQQEAEEFATATYPIGCVCENNGDFCDWHKATHDWLDNNEEWRDEWRQQVTCSECTHNLNSHHPRYGCQFERGDGYPNGSEILQAMGPCSCMHPYQ